MGTRWLTALAAETVSHSVRRGSRPDDVVNWFPMLSPSVCIHPFTRLTWSSISLCQSPVVSNQCLSPQQCLAVCRCLSLSRWPWLCALLLSGPYFSHHGLGTVEEQVLCFFCGENRASSEWNDMWLTELQLTEEAVVSTTLKPHSLCYCISPKAIRHWRQIDRERLVQQLPYFPYSRAPHQHNDTKHTGRVDLWRQH